MNQLSLARIQTKIDHFFFKNPTFKFSSLGFHVTVALSTVLPALGIIFFAKKKKTPLWLVAVQVTLWEQTMPWCCFCVLSLTL